MDTKRKTVLAVYQDIFQNIRYWEDEAKKADNPTRRELCETVAHELTHTAADLENTSEVNPIENVALMIDALVARLDKDYMGSDGMVNNAPAFQLDFKHGKAAHRLYLISTPLNN